MQLSLHGERARGSHGREALSETEYSDTGSAVALAEQASCPSIARIGSHMDFEYDRLLHFSFRKDEMILTIGRHTLNRRR